VHLRAVVVCWTCFVCCAHPGDREQVDTKFLIDIVNRSALRREAPSGNVTYRGCVPPEFVS
jgi:hypothetical protein